MFFGKNSCWKISNKKNVTTSWRFLGRIFGWVLIGLPPLEALWRNTVGRQGAAAWGGQLSRWWRMVTLVGGAPMCRVIAYYKIELRLGVRRKMMFSEIIAIIQAMNYWITYLGVGCIYIADDRRKCWDASPVPWCKVEASCDLVLSCQVFGACQVHTSHHMWLVINPPFSQSLSFPAIKNRLGSFQKLQKKNVSPCSKISYESRNPF